MTIQRQKEILIAVFVVLYSVLFFMGVVLYSGLGDNRTALATILFAAGGLIWTALIVTATAMAINRSGTNGIILTIPPLLLIILGKFTLDAMIGATLVVLLLLVLQHKVSWEVNNHIRFRITSVLYESVRLGLYILLVVVITLSLPSVIQGFKNDQDVIPAKYIAAVSQPLEPVISRWLPEYKTNSTVDDMINVQLDRQAGGIIPVTNPLLAAQKAEIRNQLGRQFGVTLTGRETVSDVTSRVVNRYIFKLTQQNHYLTVGVVIIATFIATRVVVPILIWPVLLVIRMFFYLANRIGLISIIKTTVEAERFTL